MELFYIRLLFDFGLLVLIWMVQLVVYPGFKYMDKENLLAWHKRYSKGISSIVIPLMLGQLFLSGVLLVREISAYHLADVVLVLLVWIITFSLFVPMHRTIAMGGGDTFLLRKLVVKNWFRTVVWTLIFLLNLFLALH